MNSNSSHLLSKHIICQRSGISLGNLQILLVEGGIPYLQAHNDSIYFHPFYNLSPQILLKKLEESLKHLTEAGFVPTAQSAQRLQILVSSLTWSLGTESDPAVKQEFPSLPAFPVAIGTAHRLLVLAKWYHLISSKRLQFPIYSISKLNGNLNWENFRDWLDDAFSVRQEWESKVRQRTLEEEKRIRDEALKEIKAEDIYTKLDLRKIWKWIDIQLEAGGISAGRRTTFQNLFLNGATEPECWIPDDIDDLVEAIYDHCDKGNEINFFIKKRLTAIRLLINDFYSGFTLLGEKKSDGVQEPAEQTETEKKFMQEFDDKIETLEELPPKPQRNGFANFALFVQAEARWNILRKRWDMKVAASSEVEREHSQGTQANSVPVPNPNS